MAERENKRDFFDGVAHEFDAEDLLSEHGEKVAWMLERWRLAPGMTVLEPGCGAGQLTETLLREVSPGGRVIALDSSPKMLAAARRRVEPLRSELGSRATLVECSLEDFQPPPGVVDAVIAFRMLPHLDDIPAALGKIAKGLKPGGVLFIDHPAGRDSVNRFHGEIGGAVGGDVIPEERELRRMLQEAGFELVQLIDREDIYHVEARRRRRVGCTRFA